MWGVLWGSQRWLLPDQRNIFVWNGWPLEVRKAA
jgi:hypothetical protein